MRKTDSGPFQKGKLRLTDCACLCFGVLATLGIGFGVSTCVSALSPNPALAAESEQQVDLSDPDIHVTYGTDGTTHVDVYVDKNDMSNVNIEARGDANSDARSVDDTRVDSDPFDEATDKVSTEIQKTTETPVSASSDSNTRDEKSVENPSSDATQKHVKKHKSDPNPPSAKKHVNKPDKKHKSDVVSKPSSDDVVYKIVWGDTLWQISKDTGYSIDFLAKYNNIADPNLIIAGSTLRYPRK